MSLPHLSSPRPFLCEPGLETTLYFTHHIDLPCFSSTPLLTNPSHRALITSLYHAYLAIARTANTGIILDTRTWRASLPWAQHLNLSPERLLALNRDAVALVKSVRDTSPSNSTPILISGTMGPLGDAYASDSDISLETAREGYAAQVETLVEEGVDLLGLYTISNLNEAEAVIQLAREADAPVVVSLSIESDGRLLGGQSLEEAIRELDSRTDAYVLYYGVNCAHPVRVLQALNGMDEEVKRRIGMIKGNASLKSHGELDNSETVDRGDLKLYVEATQEVLRFLPCVRVVGGCCGTDEEHLRGIAGVI